MIPAVGEVFMRIFFVDTQKSFVGKGFPPCLRVFFGGIFTTNLWLHCDL